MLPVKGDIFGAYNFIEEMSSASVRFAGNIDAKLKRECL